MKNHSSVRMSTGYLLLERGSDGVQLVEEMVDMSFSNHIRLRFSNWPLQCIWCEAEVKCIAIIFTGELSSFSFCRHCWDKLRKRVGNTLPLPEWTRTQLELRYFDDNTRLIKSTSKKNRLLLKRIEGRPSWALEADREATRKRTGGKAGLCADSGWEELVLHGRKDEGPSVVLRTKRRSFRDVQKARE